jgi:hypothetical protein
LRRIGGRALRRDHQHVDRTVECGGGAGEAFTLSGDLAAGARQAFAQHGRHAAGFARSLGEAADRRGERALQLLGLGLDGGRVVVA